MKIIQSLQYFPCQKPRHENQPLNLICGDPNCSHPELICVSCWEEEHENHLCLPLKEYLSKVYKAVNDMTEKEIIKSLENLEDVKKEAILGLEKLREEIDLKIDMLVGEIQAQYNIHGAKMKNICQIKSIIESLTNSNTKNLLIHHDEIKNENNQEENQRSIEKKLNNQKRKMAKILEYAKLYENSAEKFHDDKPFIHVFSLKDQFTSLETHFKGKCSELGLSLSKIEEDLVSKRFIVMQNAIKVPTKIHHRVESAIFSWSQTLKSDEFKIHENSIERTSTNKSQRFALFDTDFQKAIKESRKILWAFKISKLVGWIGVGICQKEKIISQDLNFNYTNLGHGSYLISSNGYSWSTSQQSNNSTKHNFSFQTGDYIVLEFCPKPINKIKFYIFKPPIFLAKLQKTVNIQEEQSLFVSAKHLNKEENGLLFLNLTSEKANHEMSIETCDDYCACVNLCSVGDCVEIIQ